MAGPRANGQRIVKMVAHACRRSYRIFHNRENENGKVWRAALDTVHLKKNIKTKPINDNEKICLIIGLYQLAIVLIRQKKDSYCN